MLDLTWREAMSFYEEEGVRNLEDHSDEDLFYLESTKRAVRYKLIEDDVESWFCKHCGFEIEEPWECEMCGFSGPKQFR